VTGPAEVLPAEGTPYRLGIVCLGNICRSPMAEVVLSRTVADAGLADRVEVTSAGTGDWHLGEPIDERAGAALRGAGYDPSRHRAQQVGADWFDRDLLLAMDATNLADLRALAPADANPARLRMFRDFDPEGGGDVPDPWYGGPEGFADVLAIVERTCAALVVALERALR
jgi:protein-tyrosine phosphatase